MKIYYQKGIRIILGIISGLIIFYVFGKIIIFVMTIMFAFGLSTIGIYISESTRAYGNVEAVTNILGFLGGAYLGIKLYKRITKKNTN